MNAVSLSQWRECSQLPRQHHLKAQEAVAPPAAMAVGDAAVVRCRWLLQQKPPPLLLMLLRLQQLQLWLSWLSSSSSLAAQQQPSCTLC